MSKKKGLTSFSNGLKSEEVDKKLRACHLKSSKKFIKIPALRKWTNKYLLACQKGNRHDRFLYFILNVIVIVWHFCIVAPRRCTFHYQKHLVSHILLLSVLDWLRFTFSLLASSSVSKENCRSFMAFHWELFSYHIPFSSLWTCCSCYYLSSTLFFLRR